MNFPAKALLATILLVEDQPELRSLLREVLEDGGYRVIIAEDADDARGRWDGSGTEIDLLVTDVVMPGGGGPALAEELKGARAGLKVLFMSANPTGLLARGVPYLQKPFTGEALLARVRELLADA